jgi:MAPEG family protein
MAILWPAFVLFALTAIVMLRLARLRFAAGEGGLLLVPLGWLYVAFRILHRAIHLSTNRVLWRFRVFAASWLVLIAYWVVLGFQLATAGGAPAAAG